MPKKETTAFVLDFLFILSSALMWTQARTFFNDPFFWMAFDEGFWLPVLLLIISVIAVLFCAGLMSALRIPLTFSLIGYFFGAVTVFFLVPFSLLTLGMASAFVLACTFFDMMSKRGIKNYVRLSFWETLHAPLGRLMLYIILAMSIGYYQAASVNIDNYTFTMPEDFSKQFIRMLVQGNPDAMKQTQIDTVSTLLEDENYIDSVIDQQIEAQGADPADVDDDQRAQIREQVEEQLKKQAETTTQQPMDEDTFYAVVKKQIEDQMNGLIKEYKPYIPAFSTFLFITALGFFNFFAVAGTVGLISLVVKVLHKLQVIRIEVEQRYVERVEW